MTNPCFYDYYYNIMIMSINKEVSRDSVVEMFYCYTAKWYLPVMVLFYTAMACYQACYCYNLYSVQDILNQELHLQHSKYELRVI